MFFKKVFLGAIAALSFSSQAIASTTTIIDENFNSLTNWKDLSTAVTWNGNPAGTSAFSLFDIGGGNKAVGLVPAALTGNYTSATGLKGFTALDFQFPTPINHASNTVVVEFRLRWVELNNTGSGEAGRFIVALNHDYPLAGLDLTPDLKYNDLSLPNTWARPAYHARLRSGNNANSFSMLQYGGGLSALGEYEKISGQWWLPGFIQSAGGGSPGTGSPYPVSSWARTATGIASTNYQTFRYIITPTTQELWRDTTGTGSFVRVAIMNLPQSSTAPLYQYFTTFSGVRLYWRGAGATRGQVFVDRIKVTSTSL